MKRLSELSKRTLVGVVAIPIVITAIFVGKTFFLILVDLILSVALWELYGMLEKKGYKPSKVLGLCAVIAISWDCYIHNGSWLIEILFIFTILTLIVELFRKSVQPVINAALTFLGVVYLSLLSSFILIREMPIRSGMPYSMGGWIVTWIFVTIWSCDSFAYIWGAKYGRHRLFPSISPKKTWEGAVGGYLMGLCVAVGFKLAFLKYFSLSDAFVFGSIVGVLGQLSDLTESLMKRDAGVKDSSRILPGHGGFLDRFDSPLFIGPSLYLYLLFTHFSQ